MVIPVKFLLVKSLFGSKFVPILLVVTTTAVIPGQLTYDKDDKDDDKAHKDNKY